MNVLTELYRMLPWQRLGWTLIHSLWQFVLIGLLLWAALKILEHRSANLRYLAACFALAAMILSGATTFFALPETAQTVFSAPNPSGEMVSGAASVIPAPHNDIVVRRNPELQAGPRESNVENREKAKYADVRSARLFGALNETLAPYLPWISFAWLGGVVILSLRNLGGWIGAHKLRRTGTRPESGVFSKLAQDLIARLKIGRPVRLLQSALVEVPVVIGWLRPAILLPASLLGEMPVGQLEAILAHELAHVRRHDYLVNLLQTIAETLLFYHPAAWWVSKRIRVEREHCCDDLAVAVCGGRLALGQALTAIEAARLGIKPALAASGNSSGGTLGRVRRLLDPKSESFGFSKPVSALLVLVLLGLTLIAGWRNFASAQGNTQKTSTAEISSKVDNPKDKKTEEITAAKITVGQHTIEGQVTDESGKPVAGALVEWGLYDDPPEKLQTQKTGDDGRYRLEIRDFGLDYRLGVSAPGKAPQWKVFYGTWNNHRFVSDEKALPPKNFVFKLEPAHRIAGIVVDDQGRSIANAKIKAQTAKIYPESTFEGPTPPMPIPGNGKYEITTNSEGRFTLGNLPAGEVQLGVTAPHRRADDRNYAVDQDCRIMMNGSGRPGIVRAKVVDQRTGKPAPEFRLVQQYVAKPFLITSADGRFQLDGDFIEGEKYSVYIYNPDYAPKTFEISALPLDSKDEPTIELSPGRPLFGRLVDAKTGQPIAGAPLLYGEYHFENAEFIRWNDWDKYVDGALPLDHVQRATTDKKGNFWFGESSERPKGTLFVYAQGYERLILEPNELPEKDDSNRLTIKLNPEASVSGVLLSGAPPKPAASARVTVSRNGEHKGKTVENFETVLTDSQGRYRIGNLGPGAYVVECENILSRRSGGVSILSPLEIFNLGAGEQKVFEQIAVPGRITPYDGTDDKKAPDAETTKSKTANTDPTISATTQPDDAGTSKKNIAVQDRLPDWLKPLQNHGLLATLDGDGEVVTVTASRVADDKLLGQLATLPKLRELHIEVTKGITAVGLGNLAKLKSLEKLSLYEVNVEEQGMGDDVIRAVVDLPALRELSISECGTTDAGVKLLERMTQLTSLSLYQEGRLTDAALESIGKLSRLKSLSLDRYVSTARLGTMRFSAEGIRRLMGLKELEKLHLVGHEVPADCLDFPKLTSLSLGNPMIGDDVAARIGELRQMQNLVLSYCRINDAGLKHIAGLPKLVHLDISSDFITDEGIGHFRRHPNLASLSLRASNVSDQSLKYLAEISSLTRLDLYGSGRPGVSLGRNFSIEGILALKSLPNLRTLYLTNFDVSGGYTRLKELQQLRVLSFMMCNIKKDEIDMLRSAMPKARITGSTGAGEIAAVIGRSSNDNIEDKKTIDDGTRKDKTTNAIPVAFAAPITDNTVQIVDDETGLPIENFSVQDRLPDSPSAPGKILWGGEESSSSGYREGRFYIGSRFVQGGNVEFRVLAGGYVPQAVKIPLENDGSLKTKTVRMKRGGTVRGKVLDHEGKPVKDARVFVRGPGELSVENGEISSLSGNFGQNVVRTDAEGRFFVTGLGKESTQVIVLAPRMYVWVASAPAEGSKEDLIIRLPQPATLKVIMDIPGAVQGNEYLTTRVPGQGPRMDPAGKNPWIRLQLQTWDMEGFKNSGDYTQIKSVANPGELVFDNLTPGLYDFCWEKMYRLGDRGSGAFCDRQLGLKLSPGETKTVNLARKRGQRVDGEILGLPKDAPGAWITVRPAEVTGDLRNETKEWKLPTFDALVCKNGEKFRTALLEPGKYKIIAQAYTPEPRNGVFSTGIRLPNYTGTAEVTIKDFDPAEQRQPVPFVKIEMKPREQKPTIY
jgi:beta-lactamase regulating signal transducer with metallopeptidase domain/protocatechuate 3,4-dioxygenase beta subunit